MKLVLKYFQLEFYALYVLLQNIVNTEIKAEEEQDFLARLQNSLRKSLDKIICSQLKQVSMRSKVYVEYDKV